MQTYILTRQAYKAIGNVAKPDCVRDLERSIWSLVIRVAGGASVHDLLPVYISVWSQGLQHPSVSEFERWFVDFGQPGKCCDAMLRLALN